MTQRRTPQTILAIDDESSGRKLAILLLEREGYRVLTAPNGEEGLVLAKAKQPNGILLDFIIPKADGHEAAGSLSTGIIDAHSTSASRKIDPRSADGTSDHSEARTGVVARIAAHTAAPRNGKASAAVLKRVLTSTLTTIADARIATTIAALVQSMWTSRRGSFWIGE